MSTTGRELAYAVLRKSRSTPPSLPAPTASQPTAAEPQIGSVVFPRHEKFVHPNTGPAEGALTIVRFLSSPPTFAVIKDRDKEKLGFPMGGSVDPETGKKDPDISVTAARETSEEIFFGLTTYDEERKLYVFGGNPAIVLKASEEELAKIAVGRNYTVYVFTCDLPADTPMQKGVEQEAAFRVPASKIERYIADEIFLPTHAFAWQIYKQGQRY